MIYYLCKLDLVTFDKMIKICAPIVVEGNHVELHFCWCIQNKGLIPHSSMITKCTKVGKKFYLVGVALPTTLHILHP